jgi:hypothetical protein
LLPDSNNNDDNNNNTNLEAVPGKHSIDSLQKTAILGTSHTQYGKYCSVKLEA